MRLLRCELRDVGEAGHVVLDLKLLPPGLVALTGENGTGKTTLLEASCPGALFRAFPSRSPGGLVDLAASRTAQIVVVYEDGGHRWRLVHEIDGDSRQADAHLYRDGSPYSDGDLVSNGKRRVFDQLVAGLWPSWRAVSTSRFLCQRGTGSWAQADANARRLLLRELLGLDDLQRLADRGRDGHRYVTTLQRAAEVRWQEASRRAAEAVQLREQLGSLKRDQSGARRRLEELTSELAAAETDVEHAEASLRAAEASERLVLRQRLEGQVSAADAALMSHETERDRMWGRLERTRTEADEAESRARTAAAQRAAWQERRRAADRLSGAVVRASTGLRAGPPDVEPLEAAVAVERAHQSVAYAADTYRRKRWQLVADLNQATHRSTLIGHVPCAGEDEYAACPLLSDAVSQQRRAVDLRAAVEDLDRNAPDASLDYGEATQQLRGAETKLSQARHACERWRTLGRLQADADAAAAGVGDEPATFDPSPARDRCSSAQDEYGHAATAVATLSAQLEHQRKELAALPPEVELLGAIDAVPPWDGPPLGELRGLVETTRGKREQQACLVAAIEATVRSVAGQLTALGNTEGAEDAPQRELTSLRKDLQRLDRIRYAFGPRGIQAVLTDAAGPAVSGIANDLLDHAYDGPRFRLEIVTRRDNRSGGQRDVAEVLVHDARRGWSGPLENASGGEVDMLASSLALGLAGHHAEVTGTRWETLWLDESGSSLTRGAAVRWLSMLRRAVTTLGLYQVLLVTHDEEVQRGCDAVVPIEELRC